MTENLPELKKDMEIDHKEISKELVVSYMESFGIADKMDNREKLLFCEIAKAMQLNPFKREIYCVPYKSKAGKKTLSIITGFEVYLKRASRSGKLKDWSIASEGSVADGDLKAIITIQRTDWDKPFVHEVYYNEYVQMYFDKPNKMWSKKPITMTKKVAMAQGFRLLFPDELAGMPYVGEEIIDHTQADPKIENRKSITEINEDF